MNNVIDIAIQRICSTCEAETPLRHLGSGFVTLRERTGIDVRIDPDEFSLCPTCGNPMRLHIQAQPYDMENHLDTPMLRALHRQQPEAPES